ncbi:MAG TPA: phosphate ABC transporter ATP-binding protein [Candidatus Cryosericum sp.]|nr:phosphate ABC transporter ATP-binding protein [Candidatus Cryosericum sp.]HPS70461.1 phosphate ABC transporter ATP-binding protein [Candidatus Cryosericum sp.]
MEEVPVVLETKDINAWFGKDQVLFNVSMQIPKKRVTAIMGPSGCGKTTFVRTLNGLHLMTPGARSSGTVLLEGVDTSTMDIVDVRKHIGMVFQRPNPFPTMTVYDNVLAGYRLTGQHLSREKADQIVETMLTKVGLWTEVQAKLFKAGTSLSGGQQQRLCIARTIAMEPDVVLFDEPTSALDPKSTAIIEELLSSLKTDYSIVFVTHGLQQAARISDYVAFFMTGELVEFGETKKVFVGPQDKRTEDYLSGKYG